MVVCAGEDFGTVRTAVDEVKQILPNLALAVLAGMEAGVNERLFLPGVRVVAPLDTTPDRLAELMAVSEAVNAKVVDGCGPAHWSGALAALSARELEVLALISRGESNSSIAAALAISRHTVQFHVGNILRKLDVRTRAEATTKAAEAAV
ncbi:LuxR C-terminal-related transcriptional regulator [Actinokineospora sp. UTMC 2448]|uniref:helix-turn-helix transcriptional regulator n=1 Tax=Actinokineospora sp. UTMC 2448 TaxID=2268449 RepID=UPI002164025A|nr:LuxR C-terminal-related transcriptional regulator [Actinokineospora sp. UTMC 2448]UVS81377.1 Response regulator protein VraR [Actinokineospora sp. UTMC 2448]